METGTNDAQLLFMAGITKLNMHAGLPVNGINGQHRISPNVGMTVFKTLSDSWHQWLQQLGLLQLTQESKCGTLDKLIRMLQVL